jgi:uncharacterized glyoxalase superfamily protein PhnB
MIKSVIPKLPFIEKQKTLDFYINQLHFDLLSDYGDYFMLEKETIELHFFSFPTLIPEKSDFMIYFRIENDIDDFYQKLQKTGILIHPNGKLEIKPWNQKEFAITDPNGTLLTFGQNMK